MPNLTVKVCLICLTDITQPIKIFITILSGHSIVNTVTQATIGLIFFGYEYI